MQSIWPREPKPRVMIGLFPAIAFFGLADDAALTVQVADRPGDVGVQLQLLDHDIALRVANGDVSVPDEVEEVLARAQPWAVCG